MDGWMDGRMDGWMDGWVCVNKDGSSGSLRFFELFTDRR